MSNRCHIFLWWLNELLLSGDCSCEILWVVLYERVSFSLQMRVSKEQEHFLVLPDGLSYGEVTASNLVRHEHTRTRPAPPPESLSLGKAFKWRSPVWDSVYYLLIRLKDSACSGHILYTVAKSTMQFTVMLKGKCSNLILIQWWTKLLQH